MSGKRGAREASIYKRASDGRWVGAISIGACKRKVFYGKTRMVVAERLKPLLKAQQDGTALRSSDRESVGAYLSKWIGGMRANVRASTWIRYRQLVDLHLVPRLGHIPLAKLAPRGPQHGLRGDGVEWSRATHGRARASRPRPCSP